VHGVEAFGFGARQVPCGRRSSGRCVSKAGVDLADHVLGDGIGLDDGQGAFDLQPLLSPEQVEFQVLMRHPGKGYRSRQGATDMNS
jgi:hypothetical protein